MSLIRVCSLAGAILITNALSAAASQDPQVQAELKSYKQTLRVKSARAGALDLSIGNVIASPHNQIGLEVSKDGTAIGKARFVFAPVGSDSTWDILVKGPISSSGDGEPLTARGLANGASVRLGYNLNLFSMTVSEEARTRGLATPYAVAAGAVARTIPDNTTFASLTTTAAAARSRTATDTHVANVLRALQVKHSLFLAASIEVGRKDYSFLNADLSEAPGESHTDHLINTGVGYSRGDSGTGNPLFFGGASYSFGDKHTAKKTRQICSPIGSLPSLECRSAVIGGPTPQKVSVVEAEFRSWSYEQRIGFNPRFVKERVRIAGLPDEVRKAGELAISYLIFKKDKDGNETSLLDASALTAGVRIGYEEGRSSGAYFSVFFGTVLGPK